MTEQDMDAAFIQWNEKYAGLCFRPESLSLNWAERGFKAGWQAAIEYARKGDAVERVARAIHNACAELDKPYPTAIPCYSMNKNKEGWRTLAKAAIAALGEK